MIKKLVIENNKNQRLVVKIELDRMKLTIEEKLDTLEIIEIYSDNYSLTVDSDIEKIFQGFYDDYIRLKDIELYWGQHFKGAEVISFKEPDKED